VISDTQDMTCRGLPTGVTTREKSSMIDDSLKMAGKPPGVFSAEGVVW
jgi:hypothetical protein